jgi:hypothetical protein
MATMERKEDIAGARFAAYPCGYELAAPPTTDPHPRWERSLDRATIHMGYASRQAMGTKYRRFSKCLAIRFALSGRGLDALIATRFISSEKIYSAGTIITGACNCRIRYWGPADATDKRWRYRLTVASHGLWRIGRVGLVGLQSRAGWLLIDIR